MPATSSASRWAKLATYIDTGRPDLATYAGLVSVGGALLTALLAGGHPSPLRLFGAWLAPTLGWVAAMYGGDYFDRDLDAVAKPHRPIPSGRISARTAFGGMVVCVALGAVIAGLLNPRNLVVVAITLALGVCYSKYLKARGIWGNLIRGGVTAMAFIMGTMSAAALPPARLLPLAVLFWLHDSGSNVVGAICDRDGDRAGGYRTFPVSHGDAAALRLLYAFDLAWLGLAIYPIPAVPGFRTAAYLPFLVLAATLGSVTVVMLSRETMPIPRLVALKSHEYLVIDRLVLAGGIIAGAGHLSLGLILAAAAVAITLASLAGMMRGRYEPRRGRLARAVSDQGSST